MTGTLYIIKNKINNKVYIGKTYVDVNKRMKMHVEDSKKQRCSGRALYRAFNKYGTGNFTYEIIGIFESGLLEEKEKEYIALYKSNKTGYNMTDGGDGKPYLNLDKHKEDICSMYTDYKMTLEDISKVYDCHSWSIKNFILSNGIELRNPTISKTIKLGKKVILVEKDKEFNSCMEAARWVKETYKSSRGVASICAGICKSCASEGYIACAGLHWNYKKGE